MRAGLLALIAVAILGAPAAHAELLEVDLNTPGDGLVTRDTDTGLDWLDLTESTDLSFDQVEADVGGFISDGWRHATGAEVCALFAAASASTRDPSRARGARRSALYASSKAVRWACVRAGPAGPARLRPATCTPQH